MRWFVLSALLLSVGGCSSAPSVERDPAALQAISPGGLNEDEARECEGYDCRYFLAPCSMMEHSPLFRSPNVVGPERYMSLKRESYLREAEGLASVGYCQKPPRQLPTETYNRDTCIFIFVKKPECRAS